VVDVTVVILRIGAEVDVVELVALEVTLRSDDIATGPGPRPVKEVVDVVLLEVPCARTLPDIMEIMKKA